MSMQLRADAKAPAAARAFVKDALARRRVPEAVCDDAVLIASELVTNAVKSSATHIAIDLRFSTERLLLIVDDDGPGWPTIMDAEDTATSGRGLGIVDRLADEWEVIPRKTGKRVRAACSLSRSS